MKYSINIHINIEIIFFFQEFLKNIIEYIDLNFDIIIDDNPTYIHFNFLSGKKWAWIDTFKKKVARIRFHEINEEVVIKEIINIYESNFLSFLNRKYIEYQKYYEEGINIREFKINFFDVLGDENSLGHYRKAYIFLPA